VLGPFQRKPNSAFRDRFSATWDRFSARTEKVGPFQRKWLFLGPFQRTTNMDSVK
jgi:hypothetical protein